MPPFGPIKRKNLIKALKSVGFEGRYSGGKHQFLIKGILRLTLPNPHQNDIGIDLLGKSSNKRISAEENGKPFLNLIQQVKFSLSHQLIVRQLF